MSLRFGISVVPDTEKLDQIRKQVQTAERVGLDLVGIQDHPYQRHFFDTWSLIPMRRPRRSASRSSATWPTCRCVLQQ